MSNLSKHHGSCICGDVHFEALVDASKGSRCNCSVCTKLGTTGSVIKPDAFTLLSDESKLAAHSRMPEIALRYFCARCHTYCFSKGHLAEVGGDFVSVNLNCIDDFDLSLADLVYWDGRHDNWQAGTRPRPWPVRAAAPAEA